VLSPNSGMYFSFSEICKAFEKAGFEITLCESPNTEIILTDQMLYEKSFGVGLDQFQPLLGYGKVCKNCNYSKVRGQCSYEHKVKIHRFNDGMEYCVEEE